MTTLSRKPAEWRGAFVQASPDGQTISILDTTGTPRQAHTPEELWALLIDLRRATNRPALVHEGNASVQQARSRVERKRRERLISQALSDPRRKAPRASDISLDQLFATSDELSLKDLFG